MMIGKSIYDHIDGKDFESQTYRFRFTEEFELEREERKLAIKLLRRRDDILKAVHLFSERFLRMPLTESSIEPILETLGHAAEVSRVYIFENRTRKDGTLATSQRFEWVAPGIKPKLDKNNLQELPWLEAGFGRWVKTLGNHKLIYGHVSKFPEPEKKILSGQDIISIMIAPIFVGNDWWGFIGLDDCRSAREWSPVEIEALKTAANVLGAAIQRTQAEEALLQSEEKYRQLFENESDAVMIFDAETRQFEDANPATLNLFGYSKTEFLQLTVEGTSAEKDKTRTSVGKVIQDDSQSAKVPLRYFKRKDGSVFPGEISAGKFISGNRQKIIGAVRDITDRLQAENKIRALNQQLIKAQENERNRIAGHLHDHVAQDLSSLKIGLETLFDHQCEVPAEIGTKICELSKILQDSISAVRDLSYDLHPPGMDQLGLVRTVNQYCEDFSEKNDVSVDFYTAGMKDLKLDFDTEINLYRLIQEGLNNIKKHAKASHVVIRLVASSPNIILRIEDNGQGFDVERRLARSFKEKRLGLFGMEERVSLLKGTMRIKSQPSKGTSLFIEVRCKEKTDD
jgi:PAS domain S-box-containing protein